MSKKTLLLQPVQGKFVQAIIHGKTSRIWLVNPDTNEQGTEVPYEEGIRLLSLPRPVVCPAQVKGKDGAFIKQLDKEDYVYIEQKKQEYLLGEQSVPTQSNPDNKVLEKLVETQSELIKTQGEQLKLMQDSFAEMKKQMDELSKNSSKKSNEKPTSKEK